MRLQCARPVQSGFGFVSERRLIRLVPSAATKTKTRKGTLLPSHICVSAIEWIPLLPDRRLTQLQYPHGSYPKKCE